VRTVEKGTPIFAPTADDAQGFAKHRMHVYYDAPAAPIHTIASAANGHLSMLFDAHVGGARARVLMDSGASHNFISDAWVRRVGAHTTTAEGASITLADGGALESTQICTVNLSLTPQPHDVTCYVMTLAPTFDIILGESWLSQHGAVLDYEKRACVLRRAN